MVATAPDATAASTLTGGARLQSIIKEELLSTTPNIELMTRHSPATRTHECVGQHGANLRVHEKKRTV